MARLRTATTAREPQAACAAAMAAMAGDAPPSDDVALPTPAAAQSRSGRRLRQDQTHAKGSPARPAGPFHAGRAGQGNNWACGNDVAVCRAGRTAQRAGGWAWCG
jgi:hypothetical protein